MAARQGGHHLGVRRLQSAGRSAESLLSQAQQQLHGGRGAAAAGAASRCLGRRQQAHRKQREEAAAEALQLGPTERPLFLGAALQCLQQQPQAALRPPTQRKGHQGLLVPLATRSHAVAAVPLALPLQSGQYGGLS